MSFSYWLPPICKRRADTGNATANGILMDHGLPKVTRFSQKPNRPPRSDRCLIMPVFTGIYWSWMLQYTRWSVAGIDIVVGHRIHPYFVIEFKPQWHGVYRVAHSFLNSFWMETLQCASDVVSSQLDQGLSTGNVESSKLYNINIISIQLCVLNNILEPVHEHTYSLIGGTSRQRLPNKI